MGEPREKITVFQKPWPKGRSGRLVAGPAFKAAGGRLLYNAARGSFQELFMFEGKGLTKIANVIS